MPKFIFFSCVVMFLIFGCKGSEDAIPKSEVTPTFSWDNATIYFLLTDRFNNGDTTNDYVHPEDAPHAPYRGFMGGDIAGITDKIEDGYFTDLGVNAIWMTPLVEQIKGSVDEGTGTSYPFHGYWARDWTAIDERFGTEEQLKEMVAAAHRRDIRVIFDVVANHTGPVTPYDEVYPDEWVKTGPRCTYQDFKTTTDCTLVDNLPDIRTESDKEVSLPPYLVDKWKSEGRYEKEVAELDDWFEVTGYKRTAVNYILKWLVDFIKEYGVDGFRVDTVKHTEPYVWANLWKAANVAWEDYKKKNKDKIIDDQPFYMMGEVYHYYASQGREFNFGDQKVDFFKDGFHSLINFDFKTDAMSDYETLFSKYNDILQGSHKGKSIVNYISSHDDGSPFDLNRAHPKDAGTKLLLCPGGVQIYYGDETARSLTVEAQGDATLRSFMNWEAITEQNTDEILKHWQKLGRFRNDHPAVGAGQHSMLSSAPYTFSRIYKEDEVVVGLELPIGSKKVNVSTVYDDGEIVYDYYSEQKSTVKQGVVSINSPHDIVLLGRK